MLRSPVALPLLCAAAVPAQQPSPQVQDLLTAEAASSRSGASGVLHRTPALDWFYTDRHHVLGEGHLLEGGLLEAGSPRAPRPQFEAESLLAILDALRGDQGDLAELTRFGERVVVTSQYPEQVEATLSRIREALPPRIRCSLRLERVVDGQPVTLLGATEVFTNGEAVAIGDLELSAAVVDADVEISAASATGNPVEAAVLRGASALLRVRPLPGRDAAVVEVVARIATADDAAPMPPSTVIGALDRVAHRFAEAGLVFRTDRGATSQHEWTDAAGSRLRLSLRADWTASTAADPALLRSPLLDAPVTGFRSWRPRPSEHATASPPREQLPLADLVASRLQPVGDGPAAPGTLIGVEGSGGVTALLRGDAGAQLRQRLERDIDHALAPCTVTLEVFDAPAGAALPADGSPPEGAAELCRIDSAGLVGLPSCFTSGAEQTYLRDWDVEVAQGSRIADPKVSLCEHGWFATVKPLPAVAGAPRRVELALDLGRFVELRQRDLPISAAMVAALDNGETKLPAETVPIEQPVTRTCSIGTVLTLDEQGTALLRRAAPRLLGPGRELVVRLRVE